MENKILSFVIGVMFIGIGIFHLIYLLRGYGYLTLMRPELEKYFFKPGTKSLVSPKESRVTIFQKFRLLLVTLLALMIGLLLIFMAITNLTI